MNEASSPLTRLPGPPEQEVWSMSVVPHYILYIAQMYPADS